MKSAGRLHSLCLSLFRLLMSLVHGPRRDYHRLFLKKTQPNKIWHCLHFVSIPLLREPQTNEELYAVFSNQEQLNLLFVTNTFSISLFSMKVARLSTAKIHLCIAFWLHKITVWGPWQQKGYDQSLAYSSRFQIRTREIWYFNAVTLS